MAVAHDASVSPPGTAIAGGASPQTWSHTCTGSDLALYVPIGSLNSADQPTTVTYNSVALTKIKTLTTADGRIIDVWRLVGPSTGANTVSISGWSGNADIVASSSSFTGVHQTVPEGTIGTTTATATSVSQNVVSSDSDEMIFDAVVYGRGGATNPFITEGAGQTLRWAARSRSGVGGLNAGSSTEPGGATRTMSWSAVASDNWASVAFAVLPVAAAAGNPWYAYAQQ